MTEHQETKKTHAKKTGSYYHWLTLLYLMGIFMMFLGPLVTITVGAIKGRRLGAYRVLMKVSIVLLVLHGILYVTWFQSAHNEAQFKSRIGELKSNAHYLQIALERFFVIECSYPVDPLHLYSEGYIKEVKNPFTGQPMEFTNYDPDDYLYSIGYIPIVYEDIGIGYYIVVFGDESTPGHDVDADGVSDNVVTVLFYGVDCYYGQCEEFYVKAREAGINPSLEEVFKDLRWIWK